VIHAYNFIRTVDKRVIEALKQKQRMVKSGRSMASATQMVDDQMRKSVSSANFQILRKEMPPEVSSPTSDRNNKESGAGDDSPPLSPRALENGGIPGMSMTGKQRAKATNFERPSVSLVLDLDQPLRRMDNGAISHHRSGAGAAAGRITTSQPPSESSGSATSEPISASSEPRGRTAPAGVEPRSSRARLEGGDSSPRAVMAAAAATRLSKSSRGNRKQRAVATAAQSSPRSRTAKGSWRDHQPHTQGGSPREKQVGVQHKYKLPPLKIKVASPRYRQAMIPGSPHAFSPRGGNSAQGQGYFEPTETFRQRSPRHGARRGGGGGATAGGGGDLQDCLTRIRSNPRAFAVVQ
jgi:hypothetical protein